MPWWWRGGAGGGAQAKLAHEDRPAPALPRHRGSVLFVALAFLSLFFFIDFVDELDGVGQRGRTAWHAVLAALLEVPGHLYELMPIAVLIGTIYSLARMAQSSEFTILRTGGLGPGARCACWRCWGWPSACSPSSSATSSRRPAERRRRC
jgi:hypothetical protein